jgi:heterodisulfide reductase subunit A-like polyferredoxin
MKTANPSTSGSSRSSKNALKIKEISPETNIYILYKDIRTYGFREKYYKEAAEKGVIFIRYDDENKPIVTNNDGLQVSIWDSILGRQIILKPDIIALSNAMLPQDGTKELSQMLKIPIIKLKINVKTVFAWYFN